MTEQRVCANDTALPKSPYFHQFGTIEDRVAHAAALFNVAPPELVYEDGDVVMNSEFVSWMTKHKINPNWLLGGIVGDMLQRWARDIDWWANPDKSHRDYKFGGFEERLAHLCALFECERPKITHDETGSIELDDGLMDWVKEHEINMDWLFAGNPDAMVREWSRSRKQSRELAGVIGKLEPEIAAGFRAMCRAVVKHGLPIDDAIAGLDQVVKEFRGGKVA